MEFDEMLIKHVGGMGRFQKLYIACYFFYALAFFSPMIELVVQGVTATHRCSTPELNSLAEKFDLGFDEILKLSAPKAEVEKRQQCHVIHRDYRNLTVADLRRILETEENGNSSEPEAGALSDTDPSPCTAWVYDRSIHGLLVAERFDLVCGREWLLTQTQTYNMAGMLVGIFVFGWLGDRFGRRPALLGSMALFQLSRAGSILSPMFTLFVVCRVVCIGAGMGFYTQGYLLAIEMVDPSSRAVAGMSGKLGFAVADAVIAGLAYWLRDYRWVMLVDGAVALPYIGYFWLLSESARWLFATGKVERGKAVLKRMARINNTTLPDEYTITKEKELKKLSPLSLLKTPEIRKRTLAQCALWFGISLINYGLFFNAINLGGSVYINLLIVGASDLIAFLHSVIALDMKCLGRRVNIFGVLILCSLCLLSMALVPSDMSWLRKVLYMLGKSSACSAFNMVYVHTPESTPTEVRSTGISVASTCARIGGIIAPYIGMLGRGNKMLPSIVLGVITLVMAFVVFLLPETLGRVLPDTIAQVEAEAKLKKDKHGKSTKSESADLMKENTKV